MPHPIFPKLQLFCLFLIKPIQLFQSPQLILYFIVYSTNVLDLFILVFFCPHGGLRGKSFKKKKRKKKGGRGSTGFQQKAIVWKIGRFTLLSKTCTISSTSLSISSL